MSRKTDTERRSAERRAGVLVRMSVEERQALHEQAAARGISVSELLRESLNDYLSPEMADA